MKITPIPGDAGHQCLRDRKTACRRWVARHLKAVAPEAWQAAARMITGALVDLPAWSRARRVALYLELADEVPTEPMVEACRHRGMDLFLPVWDADRRVYVPALWLPDDNLRLGHYGVREPEAPRLALTAALDLVLVPGRAFTRTGGRLGRGGGYYDRFLTAPWAVAAVKVGVALDVQMVDDLPMSPRDVGLDWVVTEKAVYAAEK